MKIRRVRRFVSGWETALSIGMDSMLSPAGLQADIEAFYAARHCHEAGHAAGLRTAV